LKKLLFVVLALVLAFSIVLGSCGDEEPTTPEPTKTQPTATQPTSTQPTTPAEPQPKYGGILKYIYAYSPGENIGWPLDRNTQNIWGTNYVFAESLVIYMIDGTVEPLLAESWEFAPDYSSVTFKLRDDVRFHDGTDFNADAVKFTLDANIEAGNVNALNWESIDIVDDYTVRLNFVQYENSFWQDITGTNCFFTSPTAFRENGIDWVREHPIGTGPFKFVSWERDVNMVFERNDDYWDDGKPYLDGIEFITVKEKMTAQAVMQSGDGHVLALQAGRELYDLENLGFNITAYAAGTDFLIPDTANEGSIFSDIKIRQAIEYAIDKEAVARALGYGYMKPIDQLTPHLHPFYNPNLPKKEYDVEKAKELLAEAGYPDGLKTKLYVEANYQVKALAIQAQLAAAGIIAEIEMLENLKFWEYNMGGWEGGLLFAGFAWGPNWAKAYKSFFPPAGPFFASVKPPDVTDIVDRAIATTDPDEQRELNYQLSKVLYDDVTVIPYISDAMGWATAPSVMDHHLLEGADWEYWFPADCWLDE